VRVLVASLIYALLLIPGSACLATTDCAKEWLQIFVSTKDDDERLVDVPLLCDEVPISTSGTLSAWKVREAYDMWLTHGGAVGQKYSWLLMYYGPPTEKERVSGDELVVWYRLSDQHGGESFNTLVAFHIKVGKVVGCHVRGDWYSFWKPSLFAKQRKPSSKSKGKK